MNKKPLVSIVVPIYNGSRSLSKCLNSIQVQSFSDIEVLLVDDGSTDDSLSICKKYSSSDSRFKVIKKANGGVSSARNLGIRAAAGNYVTFVDCDDWLEDDALQVMYDLLIDNQVSCVKTMYYVDSETKSKRFRLSIQEGKYEGDRVKDLINHFLSGREKCYMPLLLIDSSTLKNVGYLNETLSLMEDALFYVKVLLSTESIYMANIPTYHYYLNEHGASKSKARMLENIIQIMTVNELMVQLLKRDSVRYSKLKCTMDTSHAGLIMSYLFHIYALSGSKEVRRSIVNLKNIPNFECIMRGAVITKCSSFNKHAIRYLNQSQYNRLKILFIFKLAAKRIQKTIRKVIT